jgi:hypothetical protein
MELIQDRVQWSVLVLAMLVLRNCYQSNNCCCYEAKALLQENNDLL